MYISKMTLDGREFYKRYWEMGNARSWLKISKWAKMNGVLTSRGQYPNKMSCFKAAWRWAFYHQDDAKQIAQPFAKLDEQQWEKEFLEKGWVAYQNKKYKKMLEEYNKNHKG